MDKDDNIIKLADYKKRGQLDLRTMVEIHNKIMELQDDRARERLDAAWQQVARTIFTDFCW